MAAPLLRVIDGDTFDVDLNGNGHLDVPRERIRLLYVDTPEIHDSPKGKDLAHGLPAKVALAALLHDAPLTLRIFAGDARDAYGRTLALVTAGDRNVSLALVQAGHSYFDTRFAFPADYDRYASAEAGAFDARRGIWRDAASRERYLARLKREGKTPASAGNPLYVPDPVPPNPESLTRYLGKYVTTQGTIMALHCFPAGACVARLGNAATPTSAETAAVYAERTIARRLGVPGWRIGSTVRASGFVARYKGAVEVRLHHATRP